MEPPIPFGQLPSPTEDITAWSSLSLKADSLAKRQNPKRLGYLDKAFFELGWAPAEGPGSIEELNDRSYSEARRLASYVTCFGVASLIESAPLRVSRVSQASPDLRS